MYGNIQGTLSLAEGAEMNCRQGIRFAQNGQPGILAITNSTLRFTTDITGYAKDTFIVDGATLVPGPNTGDDSFGGFGTFVYGAGGLTIDTSEMTAGWLNVNNALRGTGVLRVRGTDIERSVCLRYVEGGHACPIEVEAGGAVALSGTDARDCTVRVHDGGAIWNTGLNNAGNPVAELVLGDDATSVTYLRGTHYDTVHYHPTAKIF